MQHNEFFCNITPVRLKDALFIAGEPTARVKIIIKHKDWNFMANQNITNIINLCSQEVEDVWSRHKIVYRSYPWKDKAPQVINKKLKSR